MRRRSPPSSQPTFLVDRSLGSKYVVEALRAAGAKAQALDDYFPQNTADVDWLVEAGQRGWVVLSKDLHMRRDSYERQVIMDSQVRAFILTRQDLPGAEMAQLFAAALPAMLRKIERAKGPLCVQHRAQRIADPRGLASGTQSIATLRVAHGLKQPFLKSLSAKHRILAQRDPCHRHRSRQRSNAPFVGSHAPPDGGLLAAAAAPR